MSRLIEEIELAALGEVELDEQGALVGSYCFPEGFLGFSGHFPGYPIVPAIVQVLVAQRLAQTRLGEGLRLQGVENAKFLLQIRPGQQIRVRCLLKPREEATLVEARLSCGETLAASFNLKFAPERPES
ncbi:hypothetical protein DESUT3_02590 [Desulfuromonas versatilis]|uniref:ApeI dehydratase-like domain-containing protein n=1 Tax=Desulfuromonas versatilis TaxID=2802975 RepID=A0ABN6DSX6_9BACT|nr:hypothetical protein [Desulfuromonas versatilis]BCR03190.1 hypothetical protein DESUT3_02590 [Desulfuromonas versatilis]